MATQTTSRTTPPWFAPRSERRRRRLLLRLLAVLLALGVVGSAAIVTNAAGMGTRWQNLLIRIDRFVAGPVPDRSSVPTVVVTAPPETPTPPPPTTEPGATPGPTPTARPTPAREALDVLIPRAADGESVFSHQLNTHWCAPAGVTMVLSIWGAGNNSDAFQNEIGGRTHEFESYDDSKNGGWGPSAMVEAFQAYGVQGYEIHAYETREAALRASAVAIQATEAPVVLLAWRGAHTWVMTGFRADADPSVFGDARITGAYILDPWYPDVSSIWGPSDPPNTFQDEAEMERNFLPWKRPEGKYPDRDGRFIVLIPTLPLDPSD